MSFIIEDGTGVSGANAYISVAEFQAHHGSRGVDVSDFDTTEIQQAIVRATDFIEQRWGLRFMGNREFRDISAARATLTFTGQPTDTETVTIDTTVYTFNTALGGANSVLIGASTTASIDNLINAVAAVVAEAGVTHGTGTIAHATITTKQGVGDTIIASAKARGTAGNGIASTETIVAASWSSATLLGGGDVVTPQPLSFPRFNLLDREGLDVRGIPEKLKQATAEYAVRAATTNLMPDPVIDDTGRAVTSKREKIGPIEEETKYADGAAISTLLRPYPAADRLLSEYVASTGRVIRG